jgi:TNF receptor-associated protein 1
MNISRELLQNSGLISKLSDFLTAKVLKWLQDEAKRDAEKYDKFYADFGQFLKEGVCTSQPPHQVSTLIISK